MKKDRSKIKCPSCNKWYLEDQYVKACCPNCGVRNPLFKKPDEEECGNCHSYVEPGDNYCRYCGTKVGEKFEPYLNIMETLYGPPPEETKHECIYCGNRWSAWVFEYCEQENYCPVCGKKEEKH